jgi:hypothetical protein
MEGTMVNNLNQPGKKKLKWLLLTIALAFIILGLAVVFGSKLKDFKMNMATTSEYQAVFLTNGQVYFGKLDFEHGWIVLNDVYYLQLAEDLQPASAGDSNADAKPDDAQNQQQKIQLVKLGAELHGPEDEMFIAKDKILFWENMKDDAKVMQSIKQFQNK